MTGRKPGSGSVRPERRRRPGRARSRIVVVDDNRPNREYLHEVLAEAGYEVELCASAADAMRAIASMSPDLVISDVHMRPMDGFALFRTVRDRPRTKDVRFMFVSSTVWGEAEIQRGMAMGASAFVLRPVPPTVILDEVARVLRGR